MRLRTRSSFIYLLVTLCAITFGWYFYIAANKTRIFVTEYLPSSPASHSNDAFASGLIQLARPQTNFTESSADSPEFEPIDCSINQNYVIDCLLQTRQNKAYLPFDFVRSYFDVYGQVRKRFDGRLYVQFEHSYSKVHYPSEKYSSKGSYLWFDTYNVEDRDRVVRMSGQFGVPESNQWSTNGHLYPIQICQFGLSHFSKHLQDSKVFQLTIEDGTLKQNNWKVIATQLHNSLEVFNVTSKLKVSSIVELDEANQTNAIVSISTDGTEDEVGFALHLRRKAPFFRNLLISIKLQSNRNFRLRFLITSDSNDQQFNLIYTNQPKNETNEQTQPACMHYIGSCSNWTLFARNLGIDLIKCYSLSNVNKKKKSWRILRAYFAGDVRFDNFTLNSNLHWIHFEQAVDWAIKSQDANGGWPVQVQRTLLKNRLKLASGWYSAMGQGQAISLLVRKHFSTKPINLKYLSAAVAALQLFNRSNTEGGVRATFMNRYVWYEEYPTNESLFVLNGFIYSLFGLYDLKVALETTLPLLNSNLSASNQTVIQLQLEKGLNQTSTLFSDGLRSLLKLLPLYDTGSGSLYDLRHFSLQTAPNLARWDYHTTHINQLLYLNSILNLPVLRKTADRWIGYMQGIRASHN